MKNGHVIKLTLGAESPEIVYIAIDRIDFAKVVFRSKKKGNKNDSLGDAAIHLVEYIELHFNGTKFLLGNEDPNKEAYEQLKESLEWLLEEE